MKVSFTHKGYLLLLSLSLIIVAAGVVYALGATPNPGHSVSELQKCDTDGQILKMSGGTWTCAADSGGSGGSSQWVDGASGKIYYNSGNVGIGVSDPNSTLEVWRGEVRFPGGSGQTIGPYKTHFNWSANGYNYIRGNTAIADSGGTVGIGTTPAGDKRLYVVADTNQYGIFASSISPNYYAGHFTGNTHGIYAQGIDYGGYFVSTNTNGDSAFAGLFDAYRVSTGILARSYNADNSKIISYGYLANGAYGGMFDVDSPSGALIVANISSFNAGDESRIM